MADPSRPRYVPTKQRRKQQQRFHGAFTGGFSAGFFNTVGSKEGWKPRSHQQDVEEVDESALHLPVHEDDGNNNAVYTKRQQKRPQQKLEDFMDEQDHDEWGGPTAIRKEYSSSNNAQLGTGGGTTIEDWMKLSIEPPPNLGNRLLRVLGWREGRSEAYVPDKQEGQQQILGQNTGDGATKVVLSSKKLRKVQLQQKRVKIPPPKLDSCGLGYEPYQNAPEFKAFQEKRRKLAHERSKLGHSANVYRVSDVLGDNDDNDKKKNLAGKAQPSGKDDEDDVYVSYETVEDFVGHKSVGGFAFRDDEDDAFDDEPTSLTKASEKVRLDTEEYNNVVYEHSSDEELDRIPTSKTPAGSNELAGVLSSFADTGGPLHVAGKGKDADGSKPSGGGVTADGRKPLAGFVLGGATHDRPVRYPGPGVPLSYIVKRHEFSENEHPLVLKALSRTVQLEAADKKRSQALDEALKANAASNAPSNRLRLSSNSNAPPARPTAPMTGGAFVGLAQAMKSRFTSVTEGGTDATLVEGGLRIPNKLERKQDGNTGDATTNNFSEANEKEKKTEINVTRTTYLFTPHPLLCKRFHVPAPRGSTHNATAGAAEGEGRVTEASYFYQEILNPAASSAVPTQEGKEAQKKPKHSISSIFHDDGTLKITEDPDNATNAEEERPSMNVYKSIYEPESDEDDSASESDNNASALSADKNPPENASTDGPKATSYDKSHEDGITGEDKHGENGNANKDDNNNMDKESSIVPYKDRDHKKKRKKHSKRRKHSRSRDEKPSRKDDEEVKNDEKPSRKDGEEGKNDAGSFNGSGGDKHAKRRRRRSRSPSSDSSDLSRDSYSSHERRKRKRRRDRDRKDKKRHKHKKKKKKSSPNPKEM